jgi:hypothetical protein
MMMIAALAGDVPTNPATATAPRTATAIPSLEVFMMAPSLPGGLDGQT